MGGMENMNDIGGIENMNDMGGMGDMGGMEDNGKMGRMERLQQIVAIAKKLQKLRERKNRRMNKNGDATDGMKNGKSIGKLKKSNI